MVPCAYKVKRRGEEGNGGREEGIVVFMELVLSGGKGGNPLIPHILQVCHMWVSVEIKAFYPLVTVPCSYTSNII